VSGQGIPELLETLYEIVQKTRTEVRVCS